MFTQSEYQRLLKLVQSYTTFPEQKRRAILASNLPLDQKQILLSQIPKYTAPPPWYLTNPNNRWNLPPWDPRSIFYKPPTYYPPWDPRSPVYRPPISYPSWDPRNPFYKPPGYGMR